METDLLNLNTLWFVLIAVLWMGYFFLEGFDFGVGILLPFLGKDDTDRRVIINTIGPVWDGNEVWLLTAGGATFAAFPEWYATMFSGFYLPLFLILVALILRGVAFEFRGKGKGEPWKAWWDRAIFFGSVVPALIWGIAFANILKGLKIDAAGEYVGGFWELLNPYALLGGITSLGLFTLHGAIFLSLKTRDPMQVSAVSAARKLALPVAIVFTGFVAWTYFGYNPDAGAVPGLLPFAAVGLLFAIPWMLKENRSGWAFFATGSSIAMTVVAMFVMLYPEVLPSSIDPAYSLDVFNAASTDKTLTVMTVVAGLFVPLVLAYQGWTYWVFRKRIGREDFAPVEHG